MTFLFLEPSHAALRETLRRIIAGESDYLTANINEFDGCVFSIFPRENQLVVGIMYSIPRKALKKFDIENALTNVFEKEDLIFNEDVYDVIVKVGAYDEETQQMQGKVANEKIESIATLRTFPVLAAIAQSSAEHVSKGNIPMQRLQFRGSEAMYFGSYRENFVVVTTFTITNKDDLLLLRMFLQEMQDVKKHDRSVSSSVGFAYNQGKLPVELAKHESIVKEDLQTPGLFYCTFSLFPRHLAVDSLLKTVTHLINFQPNAMVQLSALKSFLHAKQRARIAILQSTIDQARTLATGKSKARLK